MLILTLALSVAPALASPSPAAAQQLVQTAQADVAFLAKNVANCTFFADLVKSRMVDPVAQDLTNFQARLARYSADDPRSCTSRTDLTFIAGTISEKLRLAGTGQVALRGMSGDEAMTKALSADANHPACRADDPRDPRTTRELKAYFALKAKLVALKAAVLALREQTGGGRKP